jgi:hypothetical protein
MCGAVMELPSVTMWWTVWCLVVGLKIVTVSVSVMGVPMRSAETMEGAAAREPRRKREVFILWMVKFVRGYGEEIVEGRVTCSDSRYSVREDRRMSWFMRSAVFVI